MTEKVSATETATNRYTLLDDQRLATPDGRILPVYDAGDGTLLFRDTSGRINGGRPTAVNDVLYEQATGEKLRRGKNPQHAFPAGPGEWLVTDAKKLYAQDQARPGRGRKVTIRPETAQAVKDGYYKGEKTAVSMAGQEAYGSLSEQTISFIITGRRLWYA